MKHVAGMLIAWLLVAAPMAWWPSAYAAPADKETMAQQATKVYHEALSQWKLRNYQQAADLFSQMISRFPGNESTPDANVYLAHCLGAQKKDDEYIKQLDKVIGSYSGTEIAMIATQMKLHHYMGKKDAANLFETLKGTCAGGVTPLPDYLLDPGMFHNAGSNCTGLRQHFGGDIREALVRFCDKPELAEQALAVLAGTFKQPPEKQPLVWFWSHCQLLLAAGKDDEAARICRAYLDWWGTDLRGADLANKYADYLTSRRKTEDARKIYDEILTKYEGSGGAADAGLQVAKLMAADKTGTADFFTWAGAFTKRYRLTAAGNAVDGMVLARCIELAPTDPAMAARAFKTLELGLADMPPPYRVGRLEALVRLAIAVKDNGRAAGYATQMLDDSLWSSYAFGRAQALAGSAPQIAAAVAAAKQKRQIFDPPASPAPGTAAPSSGPDNAGDKAVAAAKLLVQLNARLKDEQMRFAEEIADEMFQKYPDTAATVDAVGQMVDYYFRQVMVEPRDKWMERAINAWPMHPKAEEVLYKRTVTEAADATYDKLTKDVELALRRFPTSQYREQWLGYRIKCYEVAKDLAGKADQIVRENLWLASSGNLDAIARVVQARLSVDAEVTEEKTGATWEEWAGKFAGTHLSLNCLSQAYATYAGARPPLLEKATAVSTQLRAQTIDPGVAVTHQFTDIQLLLLAKKDAEALAAATQRLHATTRPQWRLLAGAGSSRFYLTNLVPAFVATDRLAEVKTLGEKLAKVYALDDDKEAAAWLALCSYTHSKDLKEKAKAVEPLLKIARSRVPTDLGYTYYMSAAQCAGAARYVDVLQQAMRAMPNAKHLLPRILLDLGTFQLSQGLGKGTIVQSQLASGYPSSASRDALDSKVKAVRDATKPKPKDQ